MSVISSDSGSQRLHYFVPGEVLIYFQHDANEEEAETGLPVSKDTWATLRDTVSKFSGEVGEYMGDDVPAGIVSFEASREGNARQRLSIARVVIREYTEDNIIERVEAVLNVVNELIEREPVAQGDVTLMTITPNWFASVVGTGATEGGPGTPPVPPPPPPLPDLDKLTLLDYDVDTSAPVDVQAAQHKIKNAMTNRRKKQEDVDVFILDTVPQEAALTHALQNYKTHAVLNRLFRQAPKPTITYSSELRSDPNFNFFVGGAPYPMPDHGLFIAGTVASLAPNANIHLVEVLNRQGVGTLLSALEGLQQVADYRCPGRATIVNCSFVMTVPLVKEHFQSDLISDDMVQLFEERIKLLNSEDFQLKEEGEKRKRYQPDETRVETWALRPLVDVLRLFLPEAPEGASANSLIASLNNRGVVMFAAAGNDGEDGKHPPALYPAAQNEVFGVGALHIKKPNESDPNPDNMADYSNLSDEPLTAGFLTYGGIPEEQMIGIYIHSFPNGIPSTNGWAKWTGTSFATGVMSGMTALLTAQNGLPSALKTLVDSKKEKSDRPNHVQVKQK